MANGAWSYVGGARGLFCIDGSKTHIMQWRSDEDVAKGHVFLGSGEQAWVCVSCGFVEVMPESVEKDLQGSVQYG